MEKDLYRTPRPSYVYAPSPPLAAFVLLRWFRSHTKEETPNTSPPRSRATPAYRSNQVWPGARVRSALGHTHHCCPFVFTAIQNGANASSNVGARTDQESG